MEDEVDRRRQTSFMFLHIPQGSVSALPLGGEVPRSTRNQKAAAQMTKVSIPGIRAEDELLLHCARPDIHSDAAARIRLLVQGDLDWAQLLRHAQHHGLLPLLSFRLAQTCSDAVPTDLSECLFDYC